MWYRISSWLRRARKCEPDNVQSAAIDDNADDDDASGVGYIKLLNYTNTYSVRLRFSITMRTNSECVCVCVTPGSYMTYLYRALRHRQTHTHTHSSILNFNVYNVDSYLIRALFSCAAARWKRPVVCVKAAEAGDDGLRSTSSIARQVCRVWMSSLYWIGVLVVVVVANVVAASSYLAVPCWWISPYNIRSDAHNSYRVVICDVRNGREWFELRPPPV